MFFNCISKLYHVFYFQCFIPCFIMFLGYIQVMMGALVRVVVVGCIRNLFMYYYRFFTIEYIFENHLLPCFLTVYKTLPYLLLYTMFYHVLGYIWVMMGALVRSGSSSEAASGTCVCTSLAFSNRLYLL